MTDSLSQMVNGICEKNIMEMYGHHISLYDKNLKMYICLLQHNVT